MGKFSAQISVAALSLVITLGSLAGTAQVQGAPPGPPPGGGGGGGDVVTVDCGNGDTIQGALDDGADTVNFSGTCVEDVSIDRDDVTLAGLDPNDHTLSIIQGGVTVTGARRVVIENATVTGSANKGITVIQGAAASLRNLTIEDNVGDGVRVQRGASASLNGLTIKNNSGHGIHLTQNASVEIGNTNSTNNGRRGMSVNRASYVEVEGSTFKLNNQRDVMVNHGSQVEIENSTIGPGNTSGTDAQNLRVDFSYLRLRDVAVFGDVAITAHSLLVGGGNAGTTIDGNGRLSRDSLLTHEGSSANPFTVTGNMTCATSQSGLGVVSGDFGAGGFTDGKGLDILGTVDPNCTLMNRLK